MSQTGTGRNYGAFANLPPAALGALLQNAVEVRFVMDDVIFTAGSNADACYLIIEGRVRVMRGGSGKAHVIHEEAAGGAIGEVPMFEGGTYPATAIAALPTRCMRITRDAIRDAARREPDLALILLARLAARVRNLVNELDSRTGRGTRERLAAIILERATASTGSFTLGATHQDLAETLGTVREIVVRNLRDLRDEDVIRSNGRGRYVLIDRDRLAAIAMK